MENKPQPGEKASALTTAMLETESDERQQFGPRSPVRPECPHFAAEFALDPDRIPFMCASCLMRACDECCAKWEVCHGCGGAICEGCTATGRTRRMIGARGPRREFLCVPCATTQDEALTRLAEIEFPARVSLFRERGVWNDEIAATLRRMLRIVEDSL